MKERHVLALVWLLAALGIAVIVFGFLGCNGGSSKPRPPQPPTGMCANGRALNDVELRLYRETEACVGVTKPPPILWQQYPITCGNGVPGCCVKSTYYPYPVGSEFVYQCAMIVSGWPPQPGRCNQAHWEFAFRHESFHHLVGGDNDHADPRWRRCGLL